jgi:hypothetical protein
MNVGEFMATATPKEIAEFIQYGGRASWFENEMNEQEPDNEEGS